MAACLLGGGAMKWASAMRGMRAEEMGGGKARGGGEEKERTMGMGVWFNV